MTRWQDWKYQPSSFEKLYTKRGETLDLLMKSMPTEDQIMEVVRQYADYAKKMYDENGMDWTYKQEKKYIHDIYDGRLKDLNQEREKIAREQAAKASD